MPANSDLLCLAFGAASRLSSAAPRTSCTTSIRAEAHRPSLVSARPFSGFFQRFDTGPPGLIAVGTERSQQVPARATAAPSRFQSGPRVICAIVQPLNVAQHQCPRNSNGRLLMATSSIAASTFRAAPSPVCFPPPSRRRARSGSCSPRPGSRLKQCAARDCAPAMRAWCFAQSRAATRADCTASRTDRSVARNRITARAATRRTPGSRRAPRWPARRLRRSGARCAGAIRPDALSLMCRPRGYPEMHSPGVRRSHRASLRDRRAPRARSSSCA